MDLLEASADLTCRSGLVIHELLEGRHAVRKQLAEAHATLALSCRILEEPRDRWTYIGIMRADVVAAYEAALWGVC